MKLSCGVRQIQRYFEHSGFDRFYALNFTTAPRFFQKLVRRAHDVTLATVLSWLDTDHDLRSYSVCDAGCGLGTLSIQLALRGASVLGVDFSHRMIAQAKQSAAGLQAQPRRLQFKVEDFAHVQGHFDAAVCIDVFARYSTPQVLHLLNHMLAITRSRCVISFTPKTILDKSLLALGNGYARRHDLPPVYTHRTETIIKAVNALGWEVYRKRYIASPFKIYFCCVMELRSRRLPEAEACVGTGLSPETHSAQEVDAEPSRCPVAHPDSVMVALTNESLYGAAERNLTRFQDELAEAKIHHAGLVVSKPHRGALC